MKTKRHRTTHEERVALDALRADFIKRNSEMVEAELFATEADNRIREAPLGSWLREKREAQAADAWKTFAHLKLRCDDAREEYESGERDPESLIHRAPSRVYKHERFEEIALRRGLVPGTTIPPEDLWEIGQEMNLPHLPALSKFTSSHRTYNRLRRLAAAAGFSKERQKVSS